MLRNAREHRRVGDLVTVQMQDRQHAPSRPRSRTVRVPARRERPGSASPSPTTHATMRSVVEGCAERVRKRGRRARAFVVPSPASRVRWEGSRRKRERRRARSRPRRDRSADRARYTCPRGTRSPRAWAAVARACDVDHRQVARKSHGSGARRRVEARGGAEVPEQPRLGVLGAHLA